MNQHIAIQHAEDVEIPVIEITAGWAAEAVKTIAECEDAFSYLMSACASIEYAIDMELTKTKDQQNGVWMAKAKCALKYKKAALQIVNNKRAAIADKERRDIQNARDQRLLRHIRANVSNDQFMEWVRVSGVNE